MPKVSKRDAQQPLQEAMDMDGGIQADESSRLPDKPGFAPLSTSDAEQKVEFRRVSELKLAALAEQDRSWAGPQTRFPQSNCARKRAGKLFFTCTWRYLKLTCRYDSHLTQPRPCVHRCLSRSTG